MSLHSIRCIAFVASTNSILNIIFVFINSLESNVISLFSFLNLVYYKPSINPWKERSNFLFSLYFFCSILSSIQTLSSFHSLWLFLFSLLQSSKSSRTPFLWFKFSTFKPNIQYNVLYNAILLLCNTIQFNSWNSMKISIKLKLFKRQKKNHNIFWQKWYDMMHMHRILMTNTSSIQLNSIKV